MERRDFLTKAALGGAAGLAASGAVAAPAVAQRRTQWVCVSAFGQSGLLGQALDKFAAFVKRATGGALDIQVFHAGELVPAFEAMDAVLSGAAQMGMGSPYYWGGISEAIPFVAAIPFGLNAQEQNAWAYAGGGIEMADAHGYGPLGLKFFPLGNTGNQMGGWYKREINTVEDLQGLKFRMPGLGGDILKSFGVTVVLRSGSEVLVSLTTGEIDGTEWIGPSADLGKGLYQGAQYYYAPGWHEPGTILDGFIDMAAWEALTDEQRAIVEAGTQKMNLEVLSEFQARNDAALTSLVNDHGVELRSYSDELLAALGQRSAEILPQIAARDGDATALYNHIVTFRAGMSAWTDLSEGRFINARRFADLQPVSG